MAYRMYRALNYVKNNEIKFPETLRKLTVTYFQKGMGNKPARYTRPFIVGNQAL